MASNTRESKDLRNHNDLYAKFHTFLGRSTENVQNRDKIKIGQRVVRGKNWEKGDEDGGEGNVGTVIKIISQTNQTQDEVEVQWDCQDGTFTYRTGKKEKYDLRLYDNAQTGAKHQGFACDLCREFPIRGMKWRCRECKDYNLCTECYMKYDSDYHVNHIFERKQDESSPEIEVDSRIRSTYIGAHGVFPFQKVVQREDTKKSDEKNKGTEENVSYFPYYEDHLPHLTKENMKNGVRVVKVTIDETNNEISELGTIYPYKVDKKRRGCCRRNKDIWIRWDISGKFEQHAMKDLRLFDNGEEHSVQCSACKRGIKGIRWTCPSDDLCTECYMSDKRLDLQLQRKEKRGKKSEDICSSRGQSSNSKKRTAFGMIEVPNVPNEKEKIFSCFKDDAIVFYDYYEDELPSLTEGYAQNDSRVVKVSNDDLPVIGTIKCAYEETVCIKWDITGKLEFHDSKDLKLFRTDPLMSGIVDVKDTGATSQNERSDPELKRKKKTVFGSFGGSNNPNEKETMDMNKISIARSVLGFENGEKEKMNILGLKSLEKIQRPTYFYYPDHLPDLGNNTCGYVKIKDNENDKKEIMVKCWFFHKKMPKLCEERPRLFLIYDNIGTKEAFTKDGIQDICSISKTEKNPCYLVAEKILIFKNNVAVHKKTNGDIMKILPNMDGMVLNVGVTQEAPGEEEQDIIYFKRMVEYICGDRCLPVIISFSDGYIDESLKKIAKKESIPIISFKHGGDAMVITSQKTNTSDINSPKEHVFDLKMPWARKDFQDYQESNQCPHEIVKSPKDLQNLGNFSFDALVCCMLIGVSNADTQVKPFGEENSTIYPNALSMYLLKEGKWKIPKDFVKGFFDRRSIEYIFEKKINADIRIVEFFQDLEKKTREAFKTPLWIQGYSCDVKECNGVFDTWTILQKHRQQHHERKPQDHVRISELYGLIFYSLLRQGYYDGARQLIETGGLRVRKILVGCFILKESKDDWHTTQQEGERLNHLQEIFTHQALRIIRCMHEIDNPSVKRKRNSGNKNTEKELGKPIQHAGRLLLNHECLTDAIKTRNNTFLENKDVKNVLNQMWYGKRKSKFEMFVTYLMLTLFHVVLLPLLMINMENKPLRKLYRMYKLPVMKVLLHLIGLLALITGYAYMLLFDFDEHGISVSDTFIIPWMASFFIDETKQLLIALHRKRFPVYMKEKWNILDWFSIWTYVCGMLLKIEEGEIFAKASRIVLVLAFVMLCIRVLNMFCISELLGPQLVIIQKMFLDTFGFMAIMTVITICFNVSYHTLLYAENTDLSFKQLEDINWKGYWILFGELDLETDKLTEPHCTFNKTIYMSGEMERCPSELGRYLATYIKAIYGFIAIILMLNLLIAMYSYSFSKVKEKSILVWTQLQTDFLEEYSLKSIFPIHMQIPALSVLIIFLILWIICCFPCFVLYLIRFRKRKRKDTKEPMLNRTPMYFRVFLYDTNYDVELRKTREMEGAVALRLKGEMTTQEKDKLTDFPIALKMLERNLLQKLNKDKEDVENAAIKTTKL